ncbi:hypothetical protein [Streptomyces lunaelactis]|uniref:hypothetical protein n=1 Tax=Streptomyces lunaelactis TaxID=1535768 RepID=UPI001584562F|nr:hypothetical protein [Streptomyces lunaelactis]NUK01785.1 hypothetical protein [Streptomyces lunaelactis]NUK14979.1 hypothetical protein [Streptomyces lunaelactis]
MAISPEKARLRAAVAANTHHGHPEQADQARRELKTLVLADSIREAVENAPVPTPEQLARLRALLGGGNV